MRVFRNVWVVLLIVVIVLSAAGCSQADNPVGKKEKDVTIKHSKSLPSKLDNPNVTVLAQPSNSDEAQVIFEKGVKAFEDKYGGKVTFIPTVYGEIREKLVAALAAGDAPDVSWWNTGEVFITVINDLFQPIDDYFDLNDPRWNIDLMNQYKWKEKYYGVASGIDPFYIIFNKTLFENNGLKTPLEYYKEGKWTWENFKDVAIKLTQDTDGDGVIDQWGFTELSWGSGMSRLICTYARKSYVDFTNDGRLVMNFKESDMVEGLQFYQDALLKYKFMTHAPVTKYFTVGKAGMMLDRKRNYKETDGMKDEFDFVPSPKKPEDPYCLIPSAVGFYAIPIGAKNHQGAAAYIHVTTEISKQENELKAQKDWTEEQFKLFEEVEKHVLLDKEGLIRPKTTPMKQEIIKGQPVFSVVEKYMPIFQEELDRIIKE